MIKVKDGAEIKILRKEMYDHFHHFEAWMELYGVECVITCGTDGHKPDDPHTHGFALDLRTHDLPPGANLQVKNSLQKMLGGEYTVLLESNGTPNEHLHIQVRKDLWPTLLTKGESHAA